MKILRKLRLINWHRFEDETLEFSKSVLLSGENGAGKSTILDAIQFVITCSKANFNKAAHEKGKRTLNSYIRCKTGREDRPFERTGALSAHIALEFWDEAKNHPFIVGAVMDSFSEDKEPNCVWYLIEKTELHDDLFFKGRQVKSISAFRSSNKGVRPAQTITEAKKMILSRFGRLEEKYFSLIPKALAFKPIHDIKDFVYSYVLDAKEVNIDALRENVRSYQELENMLRDVKQRISELEVIRAKEKEVENCLRRDRNQEYYISRADKELTEKAVHDLSSQKKTSSLEIQRLTSLKQNLTQERDGKERMIRDLAIELQSDTDYQAFRELERKEGELKNLLKIDNEGVAKLRRAIKEALSLAEKLHAVWPEEECLQEYCLQLRHLQEADSSTEITLTIEKILSYKSKLYRETAEQKASLSVEMRSAEDERRELNERIRELEAKRLVYKPEVLELQRRITEQFRSMNREASIRILCEQLEVADPSWQNAVEGYLNTQRFYLITEPENFDVALSVYDRMKRQSKKGVYGVGLINTGKLEQYDTAPQGSLAECVTSKNVWARRYINMVLGKVHRCEKTQELKQYPVSITRECMRYQNHVASAIRPEIYETPYIGSGAYKVQLKQCREKKAQLDSRIAQLGQEMDVLERQAQLLSDTDPDYEVKYKLSSLDQKRVHEQALKNCRDEMSKLKASQTMIQKQIRLQEMESEKRKLETEIEKAAGGLGKIAERIANLEQSIAEAKDVLSRQEEALAALRERLGEDASFCDREYEKNTAGRDLEKYRENIERSRKANQTQKDNHEREMIEAMNRYKTGHDFGAAASLEGYPEFEAEYDKLKNSQLLEYEDRVFKARGSAEEEFREQFLSRLQENIRQAQNEFKELNKALADIRFSRESYEFRHEPRKNLKRFYDMIMDDFNVMGGASIFSGQFNEIHREAIEELFEKLALDDETSEQALEEYTDYRTYMDYDIKITLDDGSFMYYSKVSREKSGGETQTPFYITVAASFMQLYRNSIGGDSIGLIMMDEAFNNMDDERMAGVLSFMNNANLQMIIAAPPEKIQYIGPSVEKVLLVLTDGALSYVEDFTQKSGSHGGA